MDGRPRVLLDACVLVPINLCDVLLTLAEYDMFTPLWSCDILDEVERNLHRKLGVSERHARYRVSEMMWAFPRASVRKYERLIPSLTCDVKDRHVLAAAVVGRADVLMTANLRDFPPQSVRSGLESLVRESPDQFLCELLEPSPSVTLRVLCKVVSRNRRPPMTRRQLLTALLDVALTFVERVGLL